MHGVVQDQVEGLVCVCDVVLRVLDDDLQPRIRVDAAVDLTEVGPRLDHFRRDIHTDELLDRMEQKRVRRLPAPQADLHHELWIRM